MATVKNSRDIALQASTNRFMDSSITLVPTNNLFITSGAGDVTSPTSIDITASALGYTPSLATIVWEYATNLAPTTWIEIVNNDGINLLADTTGTLSINNTKLNVTNTQYLKAAGTASDVFYRCTFTQFPLPTTSSIIDITHTIITKFRYIDLNAPVVTKQAASAAANGVHTSIIATAKYSEGGTAYTDTAAYVTITGNGDTEATTATLSTLTKTITNSAAKTSYTVKTYDQPTVFGATLYDLQVVPVVFNGDSALSVILSNEAHAIPCASDGSSSDYTGSGTTIRVFQGATALTYVATLGTTKGTFSITIGSGTNITASASITGTATTTATVGQHSGAQTSKTASIPYTISIYDLDGVTTNIIKTQTFSRNYTGTNALTANLSNDVQVLPIVIDGTPNFTGCTTTMTVFSGNTDVSASATYTVTKSTGVTCTEATTSRTQTVTGCTQQTGTVTIAAVYSGSTITCVFSISKGVIGGVTANLSNDNQTLPTTTAGVVTYTGATTTMSVYVGGVDDSTNWTYAVTKSTGVTCTEATTSRTQTVTAMSPDSGTVTIVASKTNYSSITLVFTLSKAWQGATGATGANALTANLSNDVQVLPIAIDGTPNFTGCTTTMTVFSGNTDVSASATYTVTKSTGVTCTEATTSRTQTVTGCTQQTGTVTIAAVYSGSTITCVFSISKGVIGGVTANLSNDNQTLPTTTAGIVTYTGATTTMSVYVGGVDDSTNWTYAVTKSTGVTCTELTTSRTQTVTAMSPDSGTVTIVASKTNYSSITLVFTLSKAWQGATGATGANALTANLSNDVQVLPIAIDGTPNFTGCTTTMTVFSGNTDVSASATYTVTKSTGVTCTEATTSRTQTVTGCTQQTGTVTIAAVYSGSTITCVFSISKGVIGGVTANLSNDNQTLPTTTAGVVTYTGATTTMSVYVGGVDDSTNWTYAVTKSTGVTCTEATTSRTQTVTAMSPDSGTVTIVASKTNYSSITLVFTLSKAWQGATGASGGTGSPGASGATALYAYGVYNSATMPSAPSVGSTSTTTAATAGSPGTPLSNSFTGWYAQPKSTLATNEWQFQKSGTFDGTTYTWASPSFLATFQVGTLSALSVNTGILTLGTTGSLATGTKTSVDGIAGIFLGYDSTTTYGTAGYKLEVYTNSTNYLRWTSAGLSFTGSIENSSTIGGTSASTISSVASAVNNATTGLAKKLNMNASYVMEASSEFATSNFSSTTAGQGGLSFTNNGLVARVRNAVGTYDNKFVIDVTGNATFYGTVSAGSILGGTISGAVLYYNKTAITDSTNVGYYIDGTGKFRLGSSTSDLYFDGTNIIMNLSGSLTVSGAKATGLGFSSSIIGTGTSHAGVYGYATGFYGVIGRTTSSSYSGMWALSGVSSGTALIADAGSYANSYAIKATSTGTGATAARFSGPASIVTDIATPTFGITSNGEIHTSGILSGGSLYTGQITCTYSGAGSPFIMNSSNVVTGLNSQYANGWEISNAVVAGSVAIGAIPNAPVHASGKSTYTWVWLPVRDTNNILQGYIPFLGET